MLQILSGYINLHHLIKPPDRTIYGDIQNIPEITQDENSLTLHFKQKIPDSDEENNIEHYEPNLP